MSVERKGNFLPAGFAFVLLLSAKYQIFIFSVERKEGARFSHQQPPRKKEKTEEKRGKSSLHPQGREG